MLTLTLPLDITQAATLNSVTSPGAQANVQSGTDNANAVSNTLSSATSTQVISDTTSVNAVSIANTAQVGLAIVLCVACIFPHVS